MAVIEFLSHRYYKGFLSDILFWYFEIFNKTNQRTLIIVALFAEVTEIVNFNI